MSVRQRQYLVALAAILITVATAILLRAVLATVFFAITVAYVLYPVRQFLVRRGLSARSAALVSTLTAFLIGLALVTPLVGALYFRRSQLFTFLRQLPGEFSVTVGEFSYAVDITAVLTQSQTVLEDLALTAVSQVPGIVLKAFLFTLVVYALLVRPGRVQAGLLRPVPSRYHDVVLAFHERTRSILYAIYVLQAAVAFGTFLIGLVVFWLLGYESAFVLAVLSGVLQFIPILGPSIVIALLGAVEVVTGSVVDAAAVVVIGLVVVGFLPDALIRPRLARLTTGIPGSLYFVGFSGGILSVGLVGLIAGPVAVALLAEAVSLLVAESESVQQQLE